MQETLDSISGLGRSLGGGNGNPLQYSCLGNPMDRGAWRATVHRVAQSQTRLKQLSSPNSLSPPSSCIEVPSAWVLYLTFFVFWPTSNHSSLLSSEKGKSISWKPRLDEPLLCVPRAFKAYILSGLFVWLCLSLITRWRACFIHFSIVSTWARDLVGT